MDEKAAKKRRREDDDSPSHVVFKDGTDTEEDKKKQNSSILTLLDDNSLLQVLLRSHCADFPALRNTCRRFQGIVDSNLFRQQRAQQEWAQVEVHVLTAHELYKNSCNDDDDDDDDDPNNDSFFRDYYNELGFVPAHGAIQNEFRILVDGKPGGSGTYTLIQRRNNFNFHAACDAVSSDLQAAGCLFFDSRGRPRLSSVKEAMNQNKVDDNGGGDTNKTSTTARPRETNPQLDGDYFLYLDTFQLNAEHRENGSTWVGAKAIRSLLLDSPLLKDKWSVAVYIGDAKANFNEEDERRSMNQQENFFATASGGREMDQEEVQEQKDWQERLDGLAKADLRPLLCSGFQQPVDSVNKSDCFYTFAVPDFLSSRRPMLSHKEALAVKIVDKKELASASSISSSNIEMSSIDSKLLSFLLRSCARRMDLCAAIRRKEAESPPTREQVVVLIDSQMGNGLDELQRKIDATAQKN
jgi:hypothetical protein